MRVSAKVEEYGRTVDISGVRLHVGASQEGYPSSLKYTQDRHVARPGPLAMLKAASAGDPEPQPETIWGMRAISGRTTGLGSLPELGERIVVSDSGADELVLDMDAVVTEVGTDSGGSNYVAFDSVGAPRKLSVAGHDLLAGK